LPAYSLVSAEDLDPHLFAVYDVQDDGTLRVELASKVRDLYVPADEIVAAFAQTFEGVEELAGEGVLQDLLDSLAEAAIPRDASSVTALGIARNEVGEVLALDAISVVHQYLIPAYRVKHKEIGSQPSRGIDVLALDESNRVVICEVKVSNSAVSPPAVVGSGKLNMHDETLRRLAGDKAIRAELLWAFKHANDGAQPRLLKAMLQRRSPEPTPPVVAPVLVRTVAVQKATDFGVFRADQEPYQPSPVRFLILRLDEDLDAFGDEVYALAREPAA
jgi:hypothetical protein